MSDPSLRISSGEDLNANGFSTLTRATQNVLGNKLWDRMVPLRDGAAMDQRGGLS